MPRVIRTTAAAVLMATLGGVAAAQEIRATVRTHQGVFYQLGNPSLEVFYTIGEPRERRDEEQTIQSVFQMSTTITAPGGPGEAAAPRGDRDEKLLRGHSRATEITVFKSGVAVQIAWDRIKAMSFLRQPVIASGLPPYVPHNRFAVSVTLVDGERVDADYVNLGTAMLRGTTPTGHVDIPWEDVQSATFDR
jgi:hypothetical protein